LKNGGLNLFLFATVPIRPGAAPEVSFLPIICPAVQAVRRRILPEIDIPAVIFLIPCELTAIFVVEIQARIGVIFRSIGVFD